jgi:ABC-type uncharacterized transport system auxiliary subunit
MKPSAVSLTLPFVLVLALGGCGGRLPQTHYYVLEPQDVPRHDPATAVLGGWAIGVETFRVDPPYDQDRIVYRVGKNSPEVGFYAYHRWAAPLARMLPRVVAAAFGGISGMKSIEPIAPGRRYDAYIGGRVLAFEEIDTPEGHRVRVRLALHLSTDDEEMWSSTVTGQVALSSDDVGDVVIEMRSALADALRSARPGIQVALPQRPPQRETR